MKRFIFTIAIALFLGFSANRACAQGPLYLQLEKAWHAYEAALKAKKFTLLTHTWSARGLRVARNEAVATKGKFPQEIFKRRSQSFPLERFKRLRTFRRGNTASSIYIIEPSRRSKSRHEQYTFCWILFFAKEQGHWKFDDQTGGYVTSQQVRQMAAGKDIVIYDKHILPSGKIAPVPAAIKPPDYIGEMQVLSHGFQITVTFNGWTKTLTRGSDRFIIPGGLKRGKNSITITVAPLPTTKKRASKPDLSLTIDAMRTEQGLWGDGKIGVFEFRTEAAQSGTTKVFEVTEKQFKEGLQED